jgi:hypothetical protein
MATETKMVLSSKQAFYDKAVLKVNVNPRDKHLIDVVGPYIVGIDDFAAQFRQKSFRMRFPKLCRIATGIVDAFRSLEDATSRSLIDQVFRCIVAGNNVTMNKIRVGFDARVAHIVTRTLLDIAGLSDTSLFPVALNGCAGNIEAFRRFIPDYSEEDLKVASLCDRLFQLYLVMPNIVLYIVLSLHSRRSSHVSKCDKLILDIVKARATNIEKQIVGKRKREHSKDIRRVSKRV